MATLGRQTILLNSTQLQSILGGNGLADGSACRPAECVSDEKFFASLGFERVVSIDLFDAGASALRLDLNADVPADLHDQFDCVLDGGTGEHVFNFPKVMENMLRMCRTGSNLIHMNPCQGYWNHGFWNVQPTLLFDFYEANGLDECSAYVLELIDDRARFDSRARARPIARDDVAPCESGHDVLLIFRARKQRPVGRLAMPIQRIYALPARPALARSRANGGHEPLR